MIYFIYERFVYERKKVVRSLEMGFCQVFRKKRKIDFDEWEEWLSRQKNGGYITQLISENVRIEDDLRKYTAKM